MDSLRLFLLSLAVFGCHSEVLENFNLTAYPSSMERIIEYIHYEINLTLAYNGLETDLGNLNETYSILITNSNPTVLTVFDSVVNFTVEDILESNNQSVTVMGNVIGYSSLVFSLKPNAIATRCDQDKPTVLLDEYLVTVIRQSDFWDQLFTLVMAVLSIINTVNMGCGLDLGIVKQTFLRPIGPIVGFISQFTFMPLLSFGLAMLLFDDKLMGFGLFVLGVSPGGAGSNFWTLLLDGDVNLSITMTFISTIAALGMMPLWIFLMAGFFPLRNANVQIPYTDLAVSLIVLTAPLGLGLLIRRFCPRVAHFLSQKFIKPFSFFIILLSFGLGFYSLSHIFILMDWKMVVAGLCVAAAGFAFGGLFAWIMRLKKPQIIAVSMETALQNGAIAFVLLKISLSSPFSDIAALPPIAQMLMTSAILYIIFAGHIIYTKCGPGRHKAEKKAEDKKSTKLKEGADITRPLMDLSPEPISPTKEPVFHGGKVTSEFMWVKRSSLIIPSPPPTDPRSAP